MTYEELIQIFRRACGPLTVEQLMDISASGLLGLLQAAVVVQNAPPLETIEPSPKPPGPKRIGRPRGAKDKRPRKRRGTRTDAPVA